MPENSGQSAPNPWKWTAIAMAVVATTAVVTGVVVGSRRTPEDPIERVRVEAARPGADASAPARRASTSPAAPRVPDQATVKACNEQAAAKTGTRDKTTEIVKDTAVGAALGAAVGAAGGAIADGGKGAGKGAAIGGIVGWSPLRREREPQERRRVSRRLRQLPAGTGLRRVGRRRVIALARDTRRRRRGALEPPRETRAAQCARYASATAPTPMTRSCSMRSRPAR
jgi:hypothetical protein